MENKEEVVGMIKTLAEAVLQITGGVLQQRMWVRIATGLLLEREATTEQAVTRANKICDAFKERFKTEG